MAYPKVRDAPSRPSGTLSGSFFYWDRIGRYVLPGEDEVALVVDGPLDELALGESVTSVLKLHGYPCPETIPSTAAPRSGPPAPTLTFGLV